MPRIDLHKLIHELTKEREIPGTSLGHVKHSYRYHPTTQGWFFFLLTFMIMIAATTSGHNLLYLLVCVFLGVFIVMGNMAVMNLRSLRATRELPMEIYADTPIPVEIRVINPREVMDSFSIRLREIPNRDNSVEGEVFLPLVEKGKEASKEYWLKVSRRGWHELHGLEMQTRFPFGFWERSRTILSQTTLLAFPRIFHTWREAKATLMLDGEFSGRRIGKGDELLNFRNYEAGDPIRWIHWKNTAKTDRLTVALFHHPENRQAIVTLRTRYPKWEGSSFEEHVEEAISWAATATVRLLEKGVAVGYRDETSQIPPASGENHKRRILTHLALVEIGWRDETEQPHAMERRSESRDIIYIEATPTGVRIDSGIHEIDLAGGAHA
ncbi:MAG: DUF58 domain-containing protein [Candidatus Omnitrophica bacterium]|nr:DUF58 domain-containing protein [Candidatus Omnitrophota bacterium]